MIKKNLDYESKLYSYYKDMAPRINNNSKEYYYILGKPIENVSICESRQEHIESMNEKYPFPALKIALRNPDNNNWTKWLTLNSKTRIETIPDDLLNMAYEIHRSQLQNEIIIESDYKKYEDNVEAARFIGEILESKGYIPHYYYSGSKSIHIHIFLDYSDFQYVNEIILDQIKKTFIDAHHFYTEFIVWLREQLITMWNSHLREFDKDLIKSTHLIRSELSKNKFGYKTFLGYSYKDVTSIPYICNSDNRIYPQIATFSGNVQGSLQFPIKLCVPNDLETILEDFLVWRDDNIIKIQNRRSKYANNSFQPKKIRKLVEFMLSDKFKTVEDGYKRALFIVANELKRIYPPEKVKNILHDWNNRMGNPLRDSDIEYRAKTKKYTISNKYIQELLESLGFTDYK